jgi:Protein of unknown function (DUF3684)
MKKSTMLLGMAKEIDQYNTGQEEPSRVTTHELRPASEIVVIDDAASYQLFESDLVIAPQEEDLERA